jgi:CSLREA domain-containing protein
MRRHVLPVAVSLVALTTGCGGGDPSGPTFDPLAISAATLPPAVPSIAYNVSLSATGGDGSYTWSVIGGSPPSGLSLVASGVILGTPTGSTSTFTAQVVSGDGQTASQEFTISVNDVLTMTTEALPQGLMNALYNETLVASGGAGAYSWSLAAGTPPAGLSLDASSGLISGTPSVGETATFTVEVASGDGQTAQQALTIKIGFVVNTTDDSTDGACDVTHCSLREALTGANAEAGTDIVHFDIPGAGLHSIQLTSALPTISDAVFVDGYTQAGASTNTNGPELGSNAVLMIELDGTAAGSTASGLRLTAGGSTVRGLVINRFGGPAGIELLTNGGNLVEGNFIGTDAAGTVDLGNLGSGIRVDRAPDNTIGGTLPAARNVISGNESFGL